MGENTHMPITWKSKENAHGIMLGGGAPLEGEVMCVACGSARMRCHLSLLPSVVEQCGAAGRHRARVSMMTGGAVLREVLCYGRCCVAGEREREREVERKVERGERPP